MDDLLHDRYHPTPRRASPVMPERVCVGRGRDACSIGADYPLAAAAIHRTLELYRPWHQCACASVGGCVPAVIDTALWGPVELPWGLSDNPGDGWCCGRYSVGHNDCDPNPCTVEE